MTIDQRAFLLDIAGRALRGEIEDINVRTDGSLRLLNAGKELMWTGYSPEAEYLKGLVVQVDAAGVPIKLVAVSLPKFYNYTENATNDARFFEALNSPGAKVYFLVKEDGSLLRSLVNPDNGRVEWCTRGMLQAGMGMSTFGDFSAMAGEVARKLYPALLDPALVGRYTFICELIHPDNQIVTHYGDRMDLPVISVVDLETGREIGRRASAELCAVHGLSPVRAFVPRSPDFDGAVAELRASWAGTDIEGTVVTVEVPDRPNPYRIKIKGTRYLELMRLKNSCSLSRTRELAEANDLGDWISFLAYLKAQMPELPEEVRMMYQGHFARYAAWETENRAEVERLIGLYLAHPLANSPEKRDFAMAIAAYPEKWALFKLRDKGVESARPELLKVVRFHRERILRGTEPEVSVLDRGLA